MDDYYQTAIRRMQELFSEHRTDVEEICQHILDRKPINKMQEPEHRFVKFSFNGTNFLYDTYTTLVKAETEEGWIQLDCEYEHN